MSEIHGVGPSQGPQEIGRKTGRTPPPAAPVSGKKDDSVQISEAARLTSALSQVPPIRNDRVEQIRKAVQAGTYLTPEKIDRAIDGLLKDALG